MSAHYGRLLIWNRMKYLGALATELAVKGESDSQRAFGFDADDKITYVDGRELMELLD